MLRQRRCAPQACPGPSTGRADSQQVGGTVGPKMSVVKGVPGCPRSEEVHFFGDLPFLFFPAAASRSAKKCPPARAFCLELPDSSASVSAARFGDCGSDGSIQGLLGALRIISHQIARPKTPQNTDHTKAPTKPIIVTEEEA